MAQTKFGAAKTAARHYGLMLEDYLVKIQAEKSCKVCKEWKLKGEFCSDKNSGDGLGKACFACRRVKAKKCTKGRTTWMKGKQHTEESKAAMRVKHIGQLNLHRIGAVHTEATRAIISKKLRVSARRGPANHNWKGGVSPEEKRIRRSAEYGDWRLAVFTRDKFTCQQCGDNRGGNLQAHHLLGFADYPALRFDLDNGQTLCRTCHEKVHKRKL